MLDLQKEVTAFLITCGEPTTKEVLAALTAQDCRVKIKVIKNQVPMSRAFQAMLECTTPFFVQIDADMILKQHAVSTMFAGMEKAPEDVAIQAWPLWDRHLERSIFGVKIYRTEVVERYPFADVVSCEVDQLRRLEADGYRCDYHWGTPWEQHAGCLRPDDPHLLGDHAPEMSPQNAFERYSDLARKYIVTGRSDWLSTVPWALGRRFIRSNDETAAAFWGLLGWAYGLGSPEVEGEKTHGRLPPGFASLQAQLPPDPAVLNAYVSGRKCNHACWFCRNGGRNDIAPTPDLSPAILEEALDLWPSVHEVYLAGFGEPLLNQELGALVDIAASGSDVELITNGSLIVSKKNVNWSRLARVTVSLNASAPEVHMEVTGQDTWKVIMEGLEVLRDQCSNWGLSYVVTRSNELAVPDHIEHAAELGARYVCFVNLLPHHNMADSTAHQRFKEEVLTAEWWKERGMQQLVTRWANLASSVGLELRCVPRPLGGRGVPCQSSIESVGVDGAGRVGGCARVRPPGGGMITEGSRSWATQEMVSLRVARARGERDEICSYCWACD